MIVDSVVVVIVFLQLIWDSNRNIEIDNFSTNFLLWNVISNIKYLSTILGKHICIGFIISFKILEKTKVQIRIEIAIDIIFFFIKVIVMNYMISKIRFDGQVNT